MCRPKEVCSRSGRSQNEVKDGVAGNSGVRETSVKFVEDVLLSTAKKDKSIFTFDDECEISVENQEDQRTGEHKEDEVQ